MVKFKHIILFICVAASFAACKKNAPIEDPYDPVPQFKADTTAIRAFITANNIDAVKDANGIFYEIINPGSGNMSYSASTQITANYQGRLLNGTVFNDTKGTPINFVLGGVIVGWQIGIQKIQKGGTIRLILPSLYAYGTISPAASVPANSILDFTITLTDVQ